MMSDGRVVAGVAVIDAARRFLEVDGVGHEAVLRTLAALGGRGDGVTLTDYLYEFERRRHRGDGVTLLTDYLYEFERRRQAVLRELAVTVAVYDGPD
jgi:hypothetical protein